MFVGNDFLPCLPHLDIADGSLNLMMNVYRDIMPTLGGLSYRQVSNPYVYRIIPIKK